MPLRTIAKRRRWLRRVTYTTGRILLNIRKFFEKEALYDRRISMNDITQRMVLATGLGRTTIQTMRTEAEVEKLRGKP